MNVGEKYAEIQPASIFLFITDQPDHTIGPVLQLGKSH